MKAPSGKLALAYRSLAVAEEKAERFMAERDALQALLNERDAEIDRLRAEPISALLVEAREWVTDKPWDDGEFLHYRISKALGLPVSFPDWGYSQ